MSAATEEYVWMTTCPDCDGSGVTDIVPATWLDPEEWEPCETCEGTGRVVDDEAG
jgi:DnaJ-class molecular chaperone